MKKLPHLLVVSSDWICESLAAGKVLPESDHLLLRVVSDDGQEGTPHDTVAIRPAMTPRHNTGPRLFEFGQTNFPICTIPASSLPAPLVAAEAYYHPVRVVHGSATGKGNPDDTASSLTSGPQTPAVPVTFNFEPLVLPCCSVSPPALPVPLLAADAPSERPASPVATVATLEKDGPEAIDPLEEEVDHDALNDLFRAAREATWQAELARIDRVRKQELAAAQKPILEETSNRELEVMKQAARDKDNEDLDLFSGKQRICEDYRRLVDLS